MKKILIVGASRGLGKILTTVLVKKNFIYATTYRNNLNIKNKNLKIYKLNLLDTKSITNFVSNLKKIKFDIILFVAALTPSKQNNKQSTFGNISEALFKKFLSINCFSQLKLTELIIQKKKLIKNARIIFFSSLAGSISMRGNLKHNKKFGNILYRISKSALNCVVKNLAYDFSSQYIIFSLHPGYLNLGSGGKDSMVDSKFAINKIIKIILSKNKKFNGRFIDFEGNLIKW